LDLLLTVADGCQIFAESVFVVILPFSPLIFPKLGGVRPFCRIILRHCGSTKLLWNDCVEKANQGGNEGGPAQKTLKLIQTSSKHVSSLHI
jgi:hypothetical protein